MAAHAAPEEQSDPGDRVLSFYRNSTVLLTGGTGFLGKVLLEKILRCLGVRKVFLLIRSKDSRKPAERLKRLLEDAVFDRLREGTTSEQLLERLEAVEISLDADRLGMEATAEARLLTETELVFNVLASVKFNESVKNAIATNVGGTQKVLALARRMPRLKAVVHVSTLYSHCDRTTIEERVHQDGQLNPATVLQLSSTLSAEEMDQLRHCLVGNLPNTYTFSKRCAESLIAQEFSDLPVGIFRPPIVLSTYREPIAGWTDNLNGPSGLCLWTVKGFIHVIHGNGRRKANLVPVDCCVNAMIVCGYDVSERSMVASRNGDVVTAHAGSGSSCERDQLTVPTVYNYVYDKPNLTWGRYMSQVSLGFDGLLHRLWWNHSYAIVSNGALFRMLALCCHTIPAGLADLFRRACGRRPVFSKMVSKTARFLETMSYFGLREWEAANDNVVRLRTLLGQGEAQLLEFDLAAVDWDEYFRTYIPGIRRYVLGEPHDGCHWSGRWNRRIHFWCQLLYKALWIYVCLRFARRARRTYVVRNLFSILISQGHVA